MRKFLILTLLLVSCSTSEVHENSNTLVYKQADSNITQENVNSIESKTRDYSSAWKIVSNNENGRLAIVSAMGKTSAGEVQTSFLLQCPAKENPLIVVHYIVEDPRKVIGFNFDDFEGVDAPAMNEKALEIQANSPRSKISLRTAVNGNVGRFTASSAEPKITQFAQMVAKGATEAIFIMHDSRDYQSTIKTTFPAIDPSGDVAKILNGCRK